MSNKKTKNFVSSAIFFAGAGIMIKILGAIYKIELGKSTFLGEIGVSYVAFIYPYYNILLAIATAGIPIAVAKIISTHDALEEYQRKEDVFKLVKTLMSLMGVAFAVFLYVAAPYICSIANFQSAVHTMRAISIAILVVPYMATYRGYFQGHGNLKPFGISQIIEQVTRVGLGLLFAVVFYRFGIEYAAAGAVLGTSLGAVASALYLWIYQKIFKKKNNYPAGKKLEKNDSISIIKEILYYAVPISIGASIMPLIEMIDGVLIKNILMSQGYSKSIAESMFSYHAFYSESVINFPIILFVSMQISVLPAVSSLVALKDKVNLDKTIKIALKLTMIISLASSVGLFVLAKPVLAFLWPDLPEMHEKTEIILQIMCFAVFFVSIYQASSGIMQGMGLHIRNAVHLLIGALIKAIISFVLLSIPSINVKGAAVSTAITFLVAGGLNILSLKNKTELKFEFFKMILKPLSASLIMGVSVYFSYKIIMNAVGSNTFSTLISVGIGAVIYFVLILAFRILNKEDLEYLPAGRFLSKFVR